MADLPTGNLPEIAFAGRSNVGKSSLLNALTGHKALARTSNTPGRTRELNFFDLGGRLMLVDLPGYGYARVSKTEVAAWTSLVRDYLRGRVELTRLCLLIDSRHGLKKSDVEIMNMLDSSAVSYLVVLTKADKPKKGALKTLIEKTESVLKTHAAANPNVIATSSREGAGIEILRAYLQSLAAPKPLV